MGSITTGIGLISGINTAQLIDSLIAIESRGKTTLQQRVATLQTQRTAMLDINARLLNMKNAAKAFRIDRIFQAALATSSNEDVLTATAARGAQPGTFQFIVKQLVATSQQLSHGFVDRDTTPLGLSSLSFEFGRGQLSTDVSLRQLNGGAGVDRGRIKITDRSGAQATIDLTDVTSLHEVLDRINAATTVQVRASVDGDHLVITDTSGGNGSLIIANATGDTTATDLGIAKSVAGSTLTGDNINTIGGRTALASLNDGNGVLTQNNVNDLAITARDGTVINVDLGRINAPITNATLLSDLNNGAGVKIGDEDNKDIKFIARNGTSYEVNLTGVTTVGGLINRVATETAGKIQLSIHADGKRLTVTDTTGGTENLRVLGAGVNGTRTAEDLGILNVAGAAANSFDGSVIPNVASKPPAATVSDVLDRINTATGNGGKIVASIAGDGVSLLITDTTGGGGNLKVRSTVGNPYAAKALGIETSADGVASSTVTGKRVISSLGSVLVNNLNGGTGLGSATTLTLTDRAGNSVIVNNLDTYSSLADLISAVNAQAQAANVGVELGFNNVGNGLQVTDSSGGGGNLIVAGDAATALGINGSVASTAIRGKNLQHRYVSEATRLSDLNYGRGVGKGKFTITDALGDSATVDIDSDSVTLFDVIQEINSRGLAIKARVNDTGDGLLIENDLGPGQSATTQIRITAVSGSTAKDLNILGTSATIENAKIDGSYERKVALSETDNLAKVVSKINAAGIPATAAIINAGSGAAPFHVNFTSSISGAIGELHIDSGDINLGITSVTRGQDAKVFVGGGTGAGSLDNAFLITSSSNTIKSVIEGVTVNLLSVSEDPVTVTVKRDNDAIVNAVKQLVTTFNDVIGRINQYDFYDVDTQKKGALLGNATTSRVRDALYRAVQSRATGVDTQFKYLRDVGITVGTNGELKFNQDKFNQAFESDPQAVENLFAAFRSQSTEPQEILPGVTVQRNEDVVSVRGFGDLFDSLMEQFTNKNNGVVTRAENGLGDQIEFTNKRISEFDKRLQAKRARLQAQFNAMEAALARLQGQNNSLAQLASSVILAQNAVR
jgi:flagellar hook-associated protein 2